MHGRQWPATLLCAVGHTGLRGMVCKHLRPYMCHLHFLLQISMLTPCLDCLDSLS